MSYKIKSRIWIEFEDKVLLGEGRVQLLKEIDKTGSLSQAAKEIDISYKKAWELLNSINLSAKQPVTINSVGGKGGGGAELTEYGKSLISAFEEINQNCWKFLDKELIRIQNIENRE